MEVAFALRVRSGTSCAPDAAKDMRGYYRHTKIIATVGPATESRGEARQAHPRRRRCHAPQHGPWHRRLGDVAGEAHPRGLGRGAAACRGHDGRQRAGNPHRRGRRADRARRRANCSSSTPTAPTTGLRGVDVNYPGLATDVDVGATVLVDSGLIRMEVLEKDETSAPLPRHHAGRLGSRRHINLPGVDVNLPSLTEKDERDIRVGVEAGVDFFALSFVRRARRHPGAARAAGSPRLASPDHRQDRGPGRPAQP